MTTTDDDLGIPEFLDRTKDKTKEQMDAECRALNAKAATKQNEIRSPSAAMAQVPVNPLVEAQKLKRERSRVRIERRKAEKSGATKAMPLSGNEALRKIAKQATPSAAAESDALGTFPVDSIKVGERIRKDMGDIQGLAKSVAVFGPGKVSRRLIAKRRQSGSGRGWGRMGCRYLDCPSVSSGLARWGFL